MEPELLFIAFASPYANSIIQDNPTGPTGPPLKIRHRGPGDQRSSYPLRILPGCFFWNTPKKQKSRKNIKKLLDKCTNY
jgi:hypothetical protein